MRRIVQMYVAPVFSDMSIFVSVVVFCKFHLFATARHLHTRHFVTPADVLQLKCVEQDAISSLLLTPPL